MLLPPRPIKLRFARIRITTPRPRPLHLGIDVQVGRDGATSVPEGTAPSGGRAVPPATPALILWRPADFQTGRVWLALGLHRPVEKSTQIDFRVSGSGKEKAAGLYFLHDDTKQKHERKLKRRGQRRKRTCGQWAVRFFSRMYLPKLPKAVVLRERDRHDGLVVLDAQGLHAGTGGGVELGLCL